MMNIEKMRNEILDILIEKFLAYDRNFCHFSRNTLFWLFPLLRGGKDEYKKDAEQYFGYSDLEISDIWQKFLPYVRNF